MRLARADAVAEELARLALAWSRGPNDEGAITFRQVERTPGSYDVEVASIRPVPPLAAMLFSEAVHHLRSAVDNAVFHVARKEHGQPFTPEQARIVSMPVHDHPEKFDSAIKRLTSGKNAIEAFGPDAVLGKRVASLQPFNDDTVVASGDRQLARIMGVDVVDVNPLALLRDYSNEDKHRAIRVGVPGAIIQTLDDRWRESVGKGVRQIEVGTVVERVVKGVPTEIELSALWKIQRPDDTWVAFGPEIDGMARHVADVVIPTLVKGMVLANGIPAHIQLDDNGKTMAARVHDGGKARAHERMKPVMLAALDEANEQALKFAPVIDDA